MGKHMIGIAILDNLSLFDLIKVATGDLMIRIPEYPKLQTSLDPNEEPKPQEPVKLMDESKVKTLCKMEIESRLSLIQFAQQIQEKKK